MSRTFKPLVILALALAMTATILFLMGRLSICECGYVKLWPSIVLVIAFESLSMWMIRDGLTLNILMLVWPLDAVREWQAAG